jgi:hypothetical protein
MSSIFPDLRGAVRALLDKVFRERVAAALQRWGGRDVLAGPAARVVAA